MPSWDNWMKVKKARALKGEEAKQRQEEHEEIVASFEAFMAGNDNGG